MQANRHSTDHRTNAAHFAESVSKFVIVMGVALLLTGIGFLVVMIAPLREAAVTTRGRTVAPAAQPAAQL